MEEKVAQLENETNALVVNTTELVIFSAEDNLIANELLKKIMGGKRAVNEYWRVPIDNANKVHKELTRKRNEMLEPLAIGEKRVKGKIGEYLQKEREEREKIERELREAREATEKKEKERLAKIAEEEEELKKAEGFLSPEQIVAEQKKIEEANKKEFTPEVRLDKPEAPKGQIAKALWKAEVIDKALVPEIYKIVDESALNKVAVALKDKANVPGVRFYSKLSVATRG